MAKKCVKGKSCGASCVNSGKYCEVALSPRVSSALTEVRNLIELARGFGDSFESLATPEAAVDWLEENKDSLATWGINEVQLQHMVKERPSFITMGVEPANAAAKGPDRILSAVNKPGTKGDSPYRDTKKGSNGEMGDLLYKVNDYKFVSDLAKVMNKRNPEKYPKTITDLSKVLAHMGLNENKLIERLQEFGMVAQDGSLRLEPLWGTTLPKGDKKLGWRDINRTIAESVTPGAKWARINPSGLWKPSQSYSQFEGLFRAAGRDPGPFKNDNSWYKYSNEKQAKVMNRIVKEAKPKVMYIAKNGNEGVEKIVKGFSKGSGSFEIPHVQGSGKLQPLKFNYYLVPHGDGTNTAVIFGNHPGKLGFKGQIAYAEAIGKVGSQLHENGTLPREVGGVRIESK